MEFEALVVCEEMLSRKSTLSTLRKSGLVVTEAGDTRTAVRIMNERNIGAVVVQWTAAQHEIPAICSTMRTMKGFQHIACLVLSEHRSSEDVLTAVEAGADDFLASPISNSELAYRVKTAYELTKRRGNELEKTRIKHLYVNR